MVAVFTNSMGQVLACQRSDVKTAWQLPQGGIEPGESALNALYREMREEIGCDDFKIIKEVARPINYRFPDELASRMAKKWLGQSQIWFLCKFDDGQGPDLSKGDGEFSDCDWRDPNSLVQHIIEWKRAAYIEGFQKLGMIKRPDELIGG